MKKLVLFSTKRFPLLNRAVILIKKIQSILEMNKMILVRFFFLYKKNILDKL